VQGSSGEATVTAVAFTNVDVVVIDAQELLHRNIQFDSYAMSTLGATYNLFNPTAEKVAFYFKSKSLWEKEKGKILAALAKENPVLQGKTTKR
jgi:hypothetical protein